MWCYCWTLYECNGIRHYAGSGKSGDSCKTMAKRRNRSEFQHNLGKEFVIVDPSGNDWMRSVNTGSWRMKWVYCK